MNGWLLIPAALVLVALSVIMVNALKTKKGVSLEKPKAPEPAALVDEGIVARIGIASNEWGSTVHILLEERPSTPITFAFDTDHSAVALTQIGDRVRLEREDADADEYEFTNLTLGISATGE